jgi:hypothetical protein
VARLALFKAQGYLEVVKKLCLGTLVAWMVASCGEGETHHEGHHPNYSDAALSGCSGRGEALEDLELSEGAGSSMLTLSFIDAEPPVPIVGNNSWTFALQMDGMPLKDVASAITVTPLMPDHEHGTPTKVGVTEVSEGTYRFAPVHTRMAGYWEITVAIDSRELNAQLVFGVCVE